jgi:hypothetical protein
LPQQTAVPKKTKYEETNERKLKRVLERMKQRTNEQGQQNTPKKGKGVGTVIVWLSLAAMGQKDSQSTSRGSR